MVIRLSSQNTFSRPRPRWPARPAASWLTPSIRQPSPAIDPGPVIDQLVAEDGVQVPLGDRHADRHGEALAERPGGRLDAVEQEILGMAGARAAELAEALDVRRSSAVRSRSDGAARRSASSRGRRRARSGRGRASSGSAGSCFRYSVHSTVAASAMPIGMPGWPRIGGLDRVHREGADGVGERSGRDGHGLLAAWIRERTRGGAAVPLSAAARPSTLALNHGGLPPAAVMLCLGHGRPAGSRCHRPDRARAWRESKAPRTARRRPRRPGTATAPGSSNGCADAHQALRSRVEGAIGQIDRLLETGGR